MKKNNQLTEEQLWKERTMNEYNLMPLIGEKVRHIPEIFSIKRLG
jgi:hypothetical protein